MGSELSSWLANRSRFPATGEWETKELAKVASYFKSIAGSSALHDHIRDVFDSEYEICSIHRLLAEISMNVPNGTEFVIVTVNYDDLLEKAFYDIEQERKTQGLEVRPWDVVVHATNRPDAAGMVVEWRHGSEQAHDVRPRDYDPDLKARTIIYKMHGSVVRQQPHHNNAHTGSDSYVITEEDYLEFLQRMETRTAIPATLVRYFKSAHFLFLGYSLADWNLRLLLSKLDISRTRRGDSDFMGGSPNTIGSWAIQRHPSEYERHIWNKRNVNIFDEDISSFVQGMRDAIDE